PAARRAVMKIPYGQSNFADLRRGGFFYVDKTPFLPRLESDESGYRHLLFLRPRRFGKSLLLSMLEHYYSTTPESRLSGGVAGYRSQAPGYRRCSKNL